MTTRHHMREVQVRGHAIAIVERIDSHASTAAGEHWYTASKAPVAIIVHRDGESFAFDLEGAPIDLDELPTTSPT